MRDDAASQAGSTSCGGGFASTLGLRVLSRSVTDIAVEMPVTEALVQQYGYLHGGATIALLETAASLGAVGTADADETPFGVHIDIRHRRSARAGQVVTGYARLKDEMPSNAEHPDRRTQLWEVRALDESGAVISDGIIEIRIVRG